MGKYWFKCIQLKILYWWRSPKRILKNLLPDIRLIARDCGYAIAIHGNIKRDIDLIAVPWIEKAKSAEELIERIEKKINWFHTSENPTNKPHGRKAWVLVTHGVRTYIDLSVLERKNGK